MNNRERFQAIMNFEPVDRYINFEGAIWPQTMKRWIAEGLPESNLSPSFKLKSDLLEDGVLGVNMFGLDVFQCLDIKVQEPYPFQDIKILSEDERTYIYIDQLGTKRRGLKVGRLGNTSMSMDQFLDYPVKDRKSFSKWKKRFEGHYTERYPSNWEEKKRKWKNRDSVLLAPGGGKFGFYGMSVYQIGIANLPFLMHDDPVLTEEIFDFWTDYIIGLLDKAVKEVDIDYYLYFEDMACKGGPMVSPSNVKKYFVPRYKKINEFLRSNGVKHIFVDSDGNIESLIPLFIESGINGVAPLEAASGMDAVKLRKEYGKDLLMMGNIDKREIAKDKKAIETEVKYKGSIIEKGGYIPTIDHSIGPDISLENFKYYLKLKSKMLGYTING